MDSVINDYLNAEIEYGRVLKELSECETIEDVGELLIRYRVKWKNSYIKQITNFEGADVQMVMDYFNVNYVKLPKFYQNHLEKNEK